MTYNSAKPREPYGIWSALVIAAIAVALVIAASWVILTQAPARAVEVQVEPEVLPVSAPAPVEPANTPAAQVMNALLEGRAAQWAARVPAPFGCQTPDFVMSASAPTEHGSLGVHVTSAGGGRSALDQLAICGRSRTVAGAPAVRLSFTGGAAVVWQRGDVLVSLASAITDEQALTALDALVTEQLAGVCLSLEVSSADATRNPSHPAYVQYLVEREVTIDPSPADPGPAEARTQMAQVAQVTKGPEIPGPPLPRAPAKPVEPTWPGGQVSARVIQVPEVDSGGPGCGWAFTGTAAPVVDVDAIESAAGAAIATATAQLQADQLAWNGAVTTYLADLAAYEPLAAEWNAYAGQVSEVQAAWAQQRAALDAYKVALAAYEAEVASRAELIESQAAAQELFDRDVAACLAEQEAPIVPAPGSAPATPSPQPSPSLRPEPAPSLTPVPAPTPTPAPPVACPAARPAVIDAVVPDSPVEPAKPKLWSASS